MLVVGTARCAPRDTFLVRGLLGLDGGFAINEESDADSTVDLAGPRGGSCRELAAFGCVAIKVCTARATELLALVGLDFPDSVAWRSSIALIEFLLSSRPLLGRERLEAVPGGEGPELLLGESSSCFRL